MKVIEKDGKPHMVDGLFVTDIVDHYSLAPKWWEGVPERDYFLVEVGERVKEIYRDSRGWHSAKPTWG
jgi:hypothetical protein